jgi:GH35 family endo-1,4-beta-xylanase/chitodextrinase
MRNKTYARFISLLLIGLMIAFPLPSYTSFAQALTEEELTQLPGSEVLISSLQQSGAALNPEAPAYGTMEAVPVQGQSFADALRFSTNVEAQNTYSIQYVIPIEPRIEMNDVILASFYARTISSTHETAEGKASLVMEKTQTWEKSINETISIPNQWKRFLIPINATLLMEENRAQITFRLGYMPQVIEIAELKVVNYKKSVAFADLPSTPITYEGMEEDAPWRAEANQRIEQIRKGDFEIAVKDQAGQPVNEAEVQVKMTKHDFKFGTAVDSNKLFGTDADSEMYRAKLKENFNSVVMENEMKWAPWERDKAKTVRLFNWLGENQLAVRGHALIWDGPTRMPEDIGAKLSNPEQLNQRIRDHFHELAGYFKGRLFDWDVLNEPVLNKTIRSMYGDPIAADWFKLAKEADPYAKLYVNETQILGVNAPVIQNLSNLLQTMKDNGAPIDGVGIQAHFGSTPVSPMAFYDQLTHFTQYVDEIAITEFDMNSPREDIQGKFTRDLLLATFSHPNVKSFTMWGFWDGAHWQNNAPLYRKDWTLKPSGEQWRKLIYETWWTNASGQTDEQRVYKTRGFYGDYQIIVKHQGQQYTVNTSLLKGQENKVVVTLGQDPVVDTHKPFVPVPIPDVNVDITAPVWPYGSQFSSEGASPTSVTLTWPNAHDNAAVKGYRIYQDGVLLDEVASHVTRYDVRGLTHGASYKFSVAAVDIHGNVSAPSTKVTVTASTGTDRVIPGWNKGVSITVSDLTQTKAKLSWPAGVDNDGVTGYRIYMNGQPVGDTAQESYELSGLTHNTVYTARVEAKDSEGNLSYGGPVVTFRTPGSDDLAAPLWNAASLTPSDVTASSLTLSWSAAQDDREVSAYRIYQGNEELVTVPASSAFFHVKGLAENTTYRFKVEAVDSSGNRSGNGPQVTVKTAAAQDYAAPSWPESRMLTYSSLGDRTVTLQWTQASDNIEVTAYKVYKDGAVVTSVYGDQQSYTVTGLEANHTYHFRVEAGDAAGNWSVTGPAITVRTSPGLVRTQHILYPSDDAFIQAPATFGGAGTTNNIAYLRFKNASGVSGSEQNKNTGNNRRAYLKFPLSSVTGNVYEASLNLYVFAVQTANMDISMDLYATGDNWSESSINWANKPADVSNLSSSLIKNAGYWKKFAVTDYVISEVNGDKVISFKLQDDLWKDQNVDIHSKEATGGSIAFRPYLSIGTESTAIDTNPPVWTSAALHVTGLEPTAATLTWSGAGDDSGINGYKIYKDGAPIATVSSDVYRYEVKGLTPASAYTFKVEAQDASQTSTSGPALAATTPAADLTPPAWPVGAAFTAADVTRFEATLSWPAASDQYGVKEYVIYQGNVPVATVPGHLFTHRVTGLAAGTQSSFTIAARDAAGNAAAGPSVNVTTAAPDTQAPSWASQQALVVSAATASDIGLSWPAASDDTGLSKYRIYADGVKMGEVGSEINQYYITGLQADTAYNLTVVAVDAAGNVSQPLEQSGIKTLQRDFITPQWSTGSRITSVIQGTQTMLQWDPAVDNVSVKQYRIYSEGNPVGVVNGNTTSYTLQAANASAVYKVEAEDLAGNLSVLGPSTNDPQIPVPSDSTAPGWPVDSTLRAHDIKQTSMKLAWGAAVDRIGVTGYKLLMNGNAIATMNETAWQVTSLRPGTEYTFKVEATDAAGNWSASGPVLKVRTMAVSEDSPAPVTVNTPAPPANQTPDILLQDGKWKVSVPAASVTHSNGKAHTTLDRGTLQKAYEQASGRNQITIAIPAIIGTSAYAVQLPAEYLTKTGADGRSIEVSTELGQIVLPSNMLAKNKAEEAQHVTVSIARAELTSAGAGLGNVRKVVDLQVSSNEKPLVYEDKNTAVQVRIPYQLTEEERNYVEHLSVWYVDDEGNSQLVPSGRYNKQTGEMVFTTHHFSRYAVAFERKTFGDLGSVPWARQAIEVLASKGIIDGVSDSSFQPTSSVTRADFTKLLVETLSLTAAVDSSFADVSREAYYYEAVGTARKLGIVDGREGNRFDPSEHISRQDMMVIISRALQVMEKKLPNLAKSDLAAYQDAAEISSYAMDAMRAMVSSGLVEGSDGKLGPTRQSTRAEAAVMMYRLYSFLF